MVCGISGELKYLLDTFLEGIKFISEGPGFQCQPAHDTILHCLSSPWWNKPSFLRWERGDALKLEWTPLISLTSYKKKSVVVAHTHSSWLGASNKRFLLPYETSMVDGFHGSGLCVIIQNNFAHLLPSGSPIKCLIVFFLLEVTVGDMHGRRISRQWAVCYDKKIFFPLLFCTS